MRTIYSLKEFYEEVMTLAALKNKTYGIAETKINSHHGLEFRCYVDGYNFHEGKSQQEAIEKLRNEMFPLPAATVPNDDVEIELPQ